MRVCIYTAARLNRVPRRNANDTNNQRSDGRRDRSFFVAGLSIYTLGGGLDRYLKTKPVLVKNVQRSYKK